MGVNWGVQRANCNGFNSAPRSGVCLPGASEWDLLGNRVFADITSSGGSIMD